MKRYPKLLWFIGFVIGSALCCFWHLSKAGKLGHLTEYEIGGMQHLTLMFWPSALMLFVETLDPWSTVVMEIISVIANGFIYMGVGAAILQLRKSARNEGP